MFLATALNNLIYKKNVKIFLTFCFANKKSIFFLLNFDFSKMVCVQHGTKSQSNPTCLYTMFIVCRLYVGRFVVKLAEKRQKNGPKI